MWHRTAAAVILLGATLTASAQVNNVYSKAIPPDKAAMERLNLKIEWSVYVPVEGRRDTLTQIQTFDDQIFVQTRTGLLIAGDALTGQLQWTVQLGNGEYANSYPVAVNSQYVFVAHVTNLHAFHRYTGAVEFVTDLESPPTTGLAADETGVYCVLGMRTGSGGAHRITVYNLPRPIAIPDAPKGRPDPNLPPKKDPKAINPVDSLMARYAPEHMYRTNLPDVIDTPTRAKEQQAPVGGMTGSRTPSLSALPRMTPPYTLTNEVYSPSLNVLPSLRQPYRMRNDFQRDIQQTPSLGTIPPSVAAALKLTDLRPKPIQPPLRWEYGMTSRIVFPAFITPTRVWAITDGKQLTALNKVDKKVEVYETIPDSIAAPPGVAGMTAYVPLSSGYLLSIDASSGTLLGGANILWRSPIGGINNRQPFVTDSFVYASGDNSGVVCVNRETGAIVWRSEDQADRLIGANHEFVYIRDRQGKFLVYDAKRPTDPARKRSAPLSGIDLSEFNVHVTNTASDRIYLAADNGLIVCLRDRSEKYTRPVRICPEPTINLVKRGDVEIPGMGEEPKKEPEVKKEPEAKKEPEVKKEPEPKKETEPKKEPKKEPDPKKEPETKKKDMPTG
jgi:outer membrane protein assembly factor BamB